MNPRIIIDERMVGEVKIHGVSVFLPRKQYDLFVLLARNAGKIVPYETIYQHLWPNAIVEHGQIHFLKSWILKRISDAVPLTQGIIKTHTKFGYSLAVPDFEVCFVRQAPAPTSPRMVCSGPMMSFAMH